MTEKQPKTKKINDLEALATLVRSGNYAIPILDLGDRDSDGDPKLKQVPLNLLQSLFKTETNLHKVATSGKYSDLKNLPDLSQFLTQHQDISGKADKSEVFSGNYGDLQNKPDLSQFLTQHQDISGKADKSEVPLVKTYYVNFVFQNYTTGLHTYSRLKPDENSDFFKDLQKIYLQKSNVWKPIPTFINFTTYNGLYQVIPMVVVDAGRSPNYFLLRHNTGNQDPNTGQMIMEYGMGELHFNYSYDPDTAESSFSSSLLIPFEDLTNDSWRAQITCIYFGEALSYLNTPEQ